MNKRLFFSIIVLLCSMMSALSTQAQSWTASAPAAGTFYIYNVGAEKFLASGTSWGSRASIEPHGAMKLTLAVSGGGYTISTDAIYSEKYLGSDGFMDNGTSAVWTFEAVSGQSNTYKMKNGSSYLYWDGSGTWTTSVGSDPGNANGYWKLVTPDNLKASLNDASLTNPVDATFLLGNSWFAKGNGATFGRDVVPTDWTGTQVTDYWGRDTWDASQANYCPEMYHKKYDLYQTLSSMPNGIYTIAAQGFYRADGTASKVPYLYANSDQTSLKLISSENSPVNSNNNLDNAAYSFLQGYYKVEVTTKVTDGTLSLGVKDEAEVYWSAFDNFSLIYKGPDTRALSTEAIAFPGNGVNLTANTWYYYEPTAVGIHQFLATNLGTFAYTFNGDQNVNGTVTTEPLTQTLDVQQRIYFKTTAATTLTINSPTNISAAAVPYPGSTTDLSPNTWYYYDAPAEGDYTFTANSGSLSNFTYTADGAQNIYGTVTTTALPDHLNLNGRIYFTVSAVSRLTISAPATAVVNGAVAGTGDFYLYNIGARRYLTQGTTYLTHAIVDGAGQVINISGSSNAFKIHLSQVTGDKYLGNGGWVDCETSRDDYTTWTFEAVSIGGYTNVYKLKANKGGNYLHWAGGSGRWGNEALVAADANDAGYYWLLISKADRENLDIATCENPVDVTWMLKNPDIDATNTDEGANPGLANIPGWTQGAGDNFGLMDNGAAGTVAMFLEKWVDAANPLDDCETRQNIIGLPGGHYRLSFTASALRQGQDGLTITGAEFYAGDQRIAISGSAQTYNLDFLSDGNNFMIGYKVKDTNANWVYFDNVRLTYYGEVALPLPNNLTDELTVGQWYYYDVSAMGPYTLEGNIANVFFTQNGNNLLETNPTTKSVQAKLILNAGRTYFRATTAGSTLKITSINEEGQTATFTVASLNVDGLPTINIDLFNVHVNPDGRGAQGAKDISKYLMMSNKRYDLLAVQEDFNYNSELVSEFGNTYGQGTWRGEVGVGSILNPPSDTDGLNFFWNKDNGREASGESWTQYTQSVSTEGNQYIKKGFRYYEVTLADGMTVDVYITHMDAGDGDAVGSRNAQWTQLAQAVVQNSFTSRPKIVMGDFNSRYTRENIVTNFIDVVEATGNYVVKDVWVELNQGGVYPTVGTGSLSNEVVDKVIYINPTATGAMTLTPQTYSRETDYVINTVYGNGDMTALGDHGPIVVQFKAEKPAVQLPDIKDRWEWTGETAQYGQADKWYLYNVNFGRWDSGRNGFLTTDATLVRDPNLSNVKRFAMWGDASGASISTDGGVRLHMDYMAGQATYVANLITTEGATTFEIQTANEENSEAVNTAYHFYNRINARDYYFGAEAPTTLTPQRNKSKLNAWALISYEQLLVYNRYCKAWDKGNIYLTFLPLDDEVREDMTELLQRTGVRWTDTTTADLEALNAQIEAWFDDDLTSRIVNPSFELDENGNQLTTSTEYTNYVVPGWTVPHDVAEAFISNKNVSGEGWTRNFNDVDGNYVYNVYNNAQPAPNDFYVRQTITGLPEGFYKLKAVATTDTGNSITLEMGSSTFTTPVDKSRPEAIHLELPLYYHDGESDLVIGAHSKTWFEIDNFQLYRYDYYYDETITAAEYATTAIRYNTEVPAGVEVYYVTQINPAKEEVGGKVRNTMHLEKHEGSTIAAGEGVILYKGGNDANRQFRFYRTNEEASMISGNILHGNLEYIPASDKNPLGVYYMLGKQTITYDKTIEQVDEATGNVTYTTEETTEPVVGFYKVKDDAGIMPHKAYILVNTNNEPAVKGYIFSFDEEDTPTAVLKIETETDAQVMGIYSLDGKRLQALQRGMNIVRLSDGSVKKILVK